MHRTLVILGLAGICGGMGGCAQKEYDGPQRFPLAGTVTYEGRPIDRGSITFIPLAEGKRVSGGVIEEGVYSVPEAKGAHAGEHRIEIHWAKLTGRQIRSGDDLVDERGEGLPAKYHEKSELTADVPSPDNTYNFDLAP